MKKYTEIMEHIKPTPEQKNRMLEKALQGKPERKRFKLRYAAAVVAAGVIFSGTVFGEEIKNTFYGLLGRDEIVSEQVLNDVFTDSDGHVTVAVKEVLSDKINAYAIVEYTALDSEGQDWLDNSLAVNKLNGPGINPYIKDNNNAVYGVNYSYGYEEIESCRTEKSRVFKAVYDSSGENFGTDSIRFWYCLTNDWGKETSIDVTESVQLTDIKFDSSQAPDKYYKPLGVKISPLSIMIYGQDMGMFESGKTKSGGNYERFVHVEIGSLYLIMKDGTIYNMLSSESMDMGQCGYTLTHVSNPDVGYDCAIYTGAFKESVDISLIDGIELDGFYYPLGLSE